MTERTDVRVWQRVGELLAAAAVVALKSGVVPEAEARALGKELAAGLYDAEARNDQQPARPAASAEGVGA